MKSATPKVLIDLLGWPMLGHAIAAARLIGRRGSWSSAGAISRHPEGVRRRAATSRYARQPQAARDRARDPVRASGAPAGTRATCSCSPATCRWSRPDVSGGSSAGTGARARRITMLTAVVRGSDRAGPHRSRRERNAPPRRRGAGRGRGDPRDPRDQLGHLRVRQVAPRGAPPEGRPQERARRVLPHGPARARARGGRERCSSRSRPTPARSRASTVRPSCCGPGTSCSAAFSRSTWRAGCGSSRRT